MADTQLSYEIGLRVLKVLTVQGVLMVLKVLSADCAER
jgi:hypothetical protein